MLRILHLCKKFPYPLADGETMAIHAMGTSLRDAGAELCLLAMNTSRHFFRKPAEGWPAALAHYREVRMAEVDNRITPLGAFANLFSDESYHISRFQSKRFTQALEQWLSAERFDAFLLETPYLSPYIETIRRYSAAPIILRAHNVECEVWERHAALLPQGPKRWYLSYLAKKLRRYEEAMLPQYDLLLAITERDLACFRAMGFRGKGIAFPVGVSLEEYPDCSGAEGPLSLGFIGAMDWAPNAEGIRWFMTSVWPELQRAFPELQLEVAGRNMPAWVRQFSGPKARMLGEVEDARAFMARHTVLLAPILSGSGVRIKVIEGMAMGKVVLSTSVGMEGIPARPGQEVLIADSRAEFVEQVRYLYDHPGQVREIGHRARACIGAHFNRDALAKKLLETIHSLPRQPRAQGYDGNLA